MKMFGIQYKTTTHPKKRKKGKKEKRNPVEINIPKGNPEIRMSNIDFKIPVLGSRF